MREGSVLNRILIIRMHAIGDVALTLPCCAALRREYPNATIDFLTSENITPLVQAVDLFDEVISFPHCNTRFERILNTMRMQASLSHRPYQVVLDLQSNWVSKALRRRIRPDCWSEFDRQSPLPAGIRTLNAFKDAGFHSLEPVFDIGVRPALMEAAAKLLEEHQWDPRRKLLLLNPAGLWKTRQWPDDYFVSLAQTMTRSDEWQMLFLGTNRIRPRVNAFRGGFSGNVIDLVEKTDLGIALAVLQFVNLAISEDSGLMHMACACGVPTLAILGSSRSDWSRPVGMHTKCLHSGDLPCGSCMKEQCIYGDIHCLTRHRPEDVLSLLPSLLMNHTHNEITS